NRERDHGLVVIDVSPSMQTCQRVAAWHHPVKRSLRTAGPRFMTEFVSNPLKHSVNGKLTPEAVRVAYGGVIVRNNGQVIGTEHSQVVNAAALALTATTSGSSQTSLGVVLKDLTGVDAHGRTGVAEHTATQPVATVSAYVSVAAAYQIVIDDGGVDRN